jgi:hypothetical protein
MYDTGAGPVVAAAGIDADNPVRHAVGTEVGRQSEVEAGEPTVSRRMRAEEA